MKPKYDLSRVVIAALDRAAAPPRAFRLKAQRPSHICDCDACTYNWHRSDLCVGCHSFIPATVTGPSLPSRCFRCSTKQDAQEQTRHDKRVKSGLRKCKGHKYPKIASYDARGQCALCGGYKL